MHFETSSTPYSLRHAVSVLYFYKAHLFMSLNHAINPIELKKRWVKFVNHLIIMISPLTLREVGDWEYYSKHNNQNS